MAVVAQTLRSAVRVEPSGFVLEGKQEVLLCASLFYFRIPREQWASRLEQVRSSGYQAIDVYLPWNFHELAPGEWDFTGRRDVAAFLDLAHAAGLAVVARPGPYICSEWDGGALPAWLGAVEGLRVRQAEPLFLDAVGAWFEQILPLLAQRQCGEGGSVIAVQVENELDFFDTADRTAYQGALRDLVRASGITLPILACAGQGDLAGATGDADDVLPACNFYPDDSSPFVEAEVRRYRELLAQRGEPLLITETNRHHATLRRLLASGASLIAPYLQASGYNMGFTPSVGNWGDPGGFMTHDYDFAGYLSPVGQERPELAQARTLTALVRLLGADLATATPEAAEGSYVTEVPTSSSPSRLRMPGGASLLAVPNLSDDDGEVTLTRSGFAATAALPARTCLLVLEGLPLEVWGGSGRVELATADLIEIDGDRLTFAAAGAGVVILRDESGALVRADLAAPEPGRAVEVEVGTATSTWTVRVLHPGDVPGPVEAPRRDGVDTDDTDARHSLVPDRRGSLPALTRAERHPDAPWSEEVGVWRGRTHYETRLSGADQLLIEGAGDIVDVTLGRADDAEGSRHLTLTPYGASVLVPAAGADTLAVTAETWGHANFDDVRLPGLRIGSLRGLGAVWSVTSTADVGSLWHVSGPEQWSGDPEPLRTLGGWSSTRIGAPIAYRRALPVDGEHHHALHLRGVIGSVEVEVDGQRHRVTSHHPWLHLAPGQGRDVAITLPHQPGQSLAAELLRLEPVRDWLVHPEPDTVYLERVAEARLAPDAGQWPVEVPPGQEVVLELPVPRGGLSLRFEGARLRVAAVAHGELLGRVWLEDPLRPRFTGGDPGRIWLPAAWNTGSVRLLLRATGEADPGMLEAVHAFDVPE